MGSIIPPEPTKVSRTSVELPDWMLRRLDQIADETRGDRGKKEWHRSSVIAYFLDWAIREYDAEMAAKKKASKR